MIPIDDLIAHHRRREKEMSGERDRIDTQKVGRTVTEANIKRWSDSFEVERKIARDTASYLEALKSRIAR